MQLTEFVCLHSDPLVMGVAVLEEIVVAGDKKQYSVWIGRCLIIV